MNFLAFSKAIIVKLLEIVLIFDILVLEFLFESSISVIQVIYAICFELIAFCHILVNSENITFFIRRAHFNPTLPYN